MGHSVVGRGYHPKARNGWAKKAGVDKVFNKESGIERTLPK